jgi:lysophospholipase L1-like esterase
VLADGLHPTAQGVAEIVKRILPAAEDLIAKAEARRAAETK